MPIFAGNVLRNHKVILSGQVALALGGCRFMLENGTIVTPPRMQVITLIGRV